MAGIPGRRDSNTFLIGLFVLIGSVILIGAILWVGTTRFFEEHSYFVTYFDVSVEGLERGRPVKYQGVPVGKIHSVGLAPDGRLIEIVMALDPATYIDDKMRVKAEFSGITGGKFLQLYYPDPQLDKDVLADHPNPTFPPEYPVIKSSPAGIEQLEAALNQVINDLNNVNFRQTSQVLTEMMQNASRFFTDPNLYSAVAQIDEAGKRINGLLVEADTTRIVENLEDMSLNLVRASRDFRAAITNLNEQVNDMRLARRLDSIEQHYIGLIEEASGTVSLIGYSSETTMMSIAELVEELKKTNKELRGALRALNDNPTKALFSEPPPVKD